MKAANILETIGNTPHIRINRLFGGRAEVWVKSERSNPAASIKDRIALSMVEDAERSGKLKPGGVITMEFPHLMQLVDNNQFDTIYHEHFSYLSFYTVKRLFESVGLEMFDVEEIPTHGGSLRIYAKHQGDASKAVAPNVEALLQKETGHGITDLAYYHNFQQKAMDVKLAMLSFLVEQKQKGKKVAAYGAAAKGNTLLNYCGVKHDLIDFVVDSNPHKQGKYMPASHIPIVREDHLKTERPDYVIILPWNLQDEIKKQLAYIREWNGKFVVPIPSLQID